MSKIGTKRLQKEYLMLSKDPLYSEGIYHMPVEDDLYHLKVLIIGPEDTPYQYGFYFFDVKIPDRYPHEPPKAKTMTQGHSVRFNPNLYVDGKVCVSILNTWRGPQWTSCLNLRSVFISVQSLLNENPLHNEPGYENDDGDKNKDYNELITYANFSIAIRDMMMKPPAGYEIFLPIMRENFIILNKQK